MLRQYGLTPFEAAGDRKKIIRCKQAIRCLENRIVAESDWSGWNTGRKLLWRLKNLDFLLLSWLYRKRYQGIRFPALKQPLLLMLACIFLYLFRVRFLPGLPMEFLWAALFFVTGLYLLVRLIIFFGVLLLKAALNLVGKGG